MCVFFLKKHKHRKMGYLNKLPHLLTSSSQQNCIFNGLMLQNVWLSHAVRTVLVSSPPPGWQLLAKPSALHVSLMRNLNVLWFNHLVCHQSGHGASDLMVLRTFSKRTEQQEEKPRRNKFNLHIGQMSKCYRGSKSNKARNVSVCRLFSEYFENHSSDLLHTWWVCCWAPRTCSADNLQFPAGHQESSQCSQWLVLI